MTLNEYQIAAMATAVYPIQHSITYPALGLAGEAGELANKVKKVLRGDANIPSREDLIAELGDILWYVAAVARDLDATLDQVAWQNVQKLNARREAGTIKGSGDTR